MGKQTFLHHKWQNTPPPAHIRWDHKLQTPPPWGHEVAEIPHPQIWSTGRQYASYWNAYLFSINIQCQLQDFLSWSTYNFCQFYSKTASKWGWQMIYIEFPFDSYVAFVFVFYLFSISIRWGDIASDKGSAKFDTAWLSPRVDCVICKELLHQTVISS